MMPRVRHPFMALTLSCLAGLACRETVRESATVPAPATPVEASLVASRALGSPGDTILVQVRLLRAPQVAVPGSFTLRLGYDAERLRYLDDVSSRADALRAVNAEIPGDLRVAGAAPGGFAEPDLVTLRFASLASGSIGSLRLSVDQLGAPDGASLPDVVVRPTVVDPAVRP